MAMNPIQVLRGGAEEEKEIDFKMIHYLEFLDNYKNYLIIEWVKIVEIGRNCSFEFICRSNRNWWFGQKYFGSTWNG